MSKEALYKDIFKEITKSKTRFLSIMVMIALGSFMFVGMFVTGPTMRNTVITYTDKYKLEDMTVTSPLGLELEDEVILSAVSGVEMLDYAYRSDLIQRNTDIIVRVESLARLPDYEIIKGRLPKSGDEIALDGVMIEKGYELGKKISFVREKVRGNYELKNYDFVIVGFVNSPEYLMPTQKGTASLGDGVVDSFAVINEENFDLDDHSLARMTFRDIKGLDTYSDNYKKKMKSHIEEVESAFALRPEIRLQNYQKEGTADISTAEGEISKAEKELINAKRELVDARNKLDQAWIDYQEGKVTFDKEIGNAQLEIQDAQEKLWTAKDALDDGYAKLADGENKLSDSKAEFADSEKKLADAKIQLEDGENQLDAAQKKIDNGRVELVQKKAELDEGLNKVNYGLNQISTGLDDIEAGLTLIEENLPKVEAGILNASEGLPALEAGIAELDAKILDINVKIDPINNELSKIEADLTSKEEMINDLNRQIQEQSGDVAALEQQKMDLETQKVELENQATKLTAQKTELMNAKSGLEDSRADLAAQKGELESTRESLLAQQSSMISQKEEALSKKQELQSRYDELVSQKQTILDAILQLKEAEDKLEAGQKDLDEEVAKFNVKKAEYELGLAELENGRIKIADGEAELIKARAELDNGQAEYDDGVAKLEEARATFSNERTKGEAELKDAYQKILDGEVKYDKGLREYNDKVSGAKEDIEEGKTEIGKAKKDMARLKVPDYIIQDKYKEMGFFQYMENSESMDFLSYIFPIFFFLIALLVSLTTMTRMVDEQRLLIGTFKALGYSNGDIAMKYIFYGSCASLVGSMIGIVGGQKILMPVIFDAYSSNFLFKEELPMFSPVYSIFAVLISLLCTGFVAYLTTRSSLADNVATLLRPKAPKIGNRILLERITPIWQKMSFNYKVTARNIFRYKKRMLMTIIGVAGCTALIFMGFGIRDSVTSILDKQYGELFKYDTIVIFDDEAAQEDIQRYYNELKSDSRIDKFYQTRFEQGVISVPGQLDQEVYVVVPEDREAFVSVNLLRERKSKKSIELKDDAVISEKIATLLKLKAGDRLEFKGSDDKVKTIKIAGVTENYTGHYIYMPVDYYEKTFEKDYRPNSDYILLQDHSDENVSNFSRNMLDNDIVFSTFNTNTSSDTIGELTTSLNIVVLVMIIISSLLAIVVLYNLTNINVSERIRELSTIMVLGFYPKEVTAYVYRETMILTMMGILLGYVFGLIIHGFIVTALSPSYVMMDPAVQLSSYIFSAAFTIAFSVVVMVIMHIRLKNVDMVEALKAVE